MTERRTRLITRVLVANRGEIARRVLRTCRDAGIATVAVFSDADAHAPHVAQADAAVRLPGVAAGDTYLRFDLLVEAALRAGADAVHPGYGFGSESPDLARAVQEAGLVWIGPPPEAMAVMASKLESKRLMAAAGVPVLARLDPAVLTEAELPVLVKASAGGGGRGMRIVRRLGALAEALAAAGAQARSAFGDGSVVCEPYLESGHHVEVQVLADRHGTVWAVGERECSIQRRYQKVIEESPSPLVERICGMRERLFGAATTAARVSGYEGAGTVEFLADADGELWFLEMNTRLQVEHPVTEATTGLDLVKLQLDIAEGRALAAQPPPPAGWAVEARLYAEDPAANWRPTGGTMHHLDVPAAATAFTGPAADGAGSAGRACVRVDSGVEDGSVVGVHYDSLLAKVIAVAPDRGDAARALAAALAGARLHGPGTNRDLLVRVLRHEAFLDGRTDTAFLDRYAADVVAPLVDPGQERLCALAAALADAAQRRTSAAVQAGLPSGWRNVVSQPQRRRYAGPAGEHDVGYRVVRGGRLVAEGFDDVQLVRHTAHEVVLEVAGVRRGFAVRRYPAAPDAVYVDGPHGALTLTRLPRFPDPAAARAAGSLVAAMPGVVVAVLVKAGDVVQVGRPLIVLEAMKMQHTVRAPVAGTLVDVAVEVGAQVEAGAVLAVVNQDAVTAVDG